VGQPFRDNWGCLWETHINGLEGQVVENPLPDWSKLATWRPPDPIVLDDRGPADWTRRREQLAQAKADGRLAVGGLAHGFLAMRLYYLRGFDNFMCDVIDEPPELQQLVDLIVAHGKRIIDEYLAAGVDLIAGGDDLGTQTMSMLGRKHFHRWITPGYQKLFLPCRERRVHVKLHSDGYIMDLMDEFIASGITIINPQDLCNGIDALVREVKGRMCIELDIDRQTIVPFGTPKDIRNLIEEEVRKLGSPQGGLELVCGIYPPTPPENIDALASAMEEFRTWWWDGRARQSRRGRGPASSRGKRE
jgi:uroporphyrinogen decarboxylase